MRTMVLGLVLVMALLPAAAQVAAPTYAPTEIESLRLRAEYAEFQLAQNELARRAQILNADIETIKKSHNWPTTLRYEPASQGFVAPPPPPKP